MIAQICSARLGETYLHFALFDWISAEKSVRSTSVIASTAATSVFFAKRRSNNLNGMRGDVPSGQNGWKQQGGAVPIDRDMLMLSCPWGT